MDITQQKLLAVYNKSKVEQLLRDFGPVKEFVETPSFSEFDIADSMTTEELSRFAYEAEIDLAAELPPPP